MGNVFTTILLTLIVFGVIITLHELGHFLFAKFFGVRVNEFSFGMGPRLWGRQKGETQYSIRAFPIGGYVSMEGEDTESTDGRAFCNKSAWKRFIILAAGAAMNVLLGFLILIALVAQMNLLGTNVVASFHEGSVSNQYLQEGDRIVRVNGVSTPGYNDVVFHLIRDQDSHVELDILRGGDRSLSFWERLGARLGLSDKNLGEALKLTVPFHTKTYEDGTESIALDFVFYGVERTFGNTFTYAARWTASIVGQVWYSLVDIATGRFGLKEISGPVGTATIIGEASSKGSDSLMMIVAFITINVGVFNLLPLPALDGGRLFFLLIEILFRRPVPAKYEGYIHAVGLILLLGLIVVVTFSDILKIFTN